MSSKSNNTSRIYGLDGLRTLAIIGITLFHMFPSVMKGGYMGVSLFFVISGYLLAVTAERKRRRGEYSAVSFYEKRLLRIYPALLLVLLISAGVFWFLDRQSLAGIRTELFSIVFGYNNWWQIAQNADYFTRITNASPFTHMWFLAVELQFYLLWPLLYFVYRLLRQKKGLTAGLCFWLVLTLLSALLMPVLYRPDVDVTRLYYGTDSRCFALLLGVLLGLLQERKRIPKTLRRIARKFSIPLLAFFLVITCWIFFVTDGQLPFVYRGGMFLITLMFGAMVLFVADRKLPAGRWLEAAPLVWIGERSYEIYLWQYPVIFLFMIKKWSSIPAMFLLEIAIIVLLAAWLHQLAGALVNRALPAFLEEFPLWVEYVWKGAAVLSAVLLTVGVFGTVTAPREKFAEKDELARLLEENQKMLENQNEADESESVIDISDLVTTENKINELEVTLDGLNLEFADRGLTNSAEVSLSQVLMIGDSIMLDSSPQLKDEFPDCYIDAQQNRQVIKCLEVGQQAIWDGNLHNTVVISLGTNGRITESTATRIMELFGPDVSVFWVNLFGRTVTWEDEANSLLLKLTETYPNLTVIDWASVIRPHPEWLWGDGEHPNPEGSKVYAKLIRESLQVCAAKQKQESAEEQVIPVDVESLEEQGEVG